MSNTASDRYPCLMVTEVGGDDQKSDRPYALELPATKMSEEGSFGGCDRFAAFLLMRLTSTFLFSSF
jgi:hypothetical protein